MMPNPSVDFKQRQENPAPAGILLLLAVFFLLTLGGNELWRAYREQERTQAAFTSAKHQAPIKKHPSKALPTPAVELTEKQSQAALRELIIPWQDLLAILEDYPGHDVALIGIDQNPSKGQIRITGEAKDFNTMIAYLKYLQGNVLLHEAALNEHLTKRNVPGTPVRFQIVAVWRKQ